MSEWKSTAHTVDRDTEILRSITIVCSQDYSASKESYYNIDVLVSSKTGGIDVLGSFSGRKNAVKANTSTPMPGFSTGRKMLNGESIVVRCKKTGSPQVSANSFTIHLRMGVVAGNSQNYKPMESDAGYHRDQRTMQSIDSINTALRDSGVSDWTVSIVVQDPSSGSKYVEIDEYTMVAKPGQLGTGTPSASTALLGNGTWGTVSPWTYVVLGSDFSTTSSTNTNVTNFSFTPSSSKKYMIEMFFLLRSPNNITVGPRPGITWPTAGVSDSAAYLSAANSATTSVISTWGQPNTQNAAVTGVVSTSYSYPAWGTAILIMTTGATGSFQITLASETSGTSVTMKANSYFRYREYP